jgi:hypothetical protein
MITEQAASRKYATAIIRLCREIRKTELGKYLTTNETVIFALTLIHRQR